MGGVDKWLLKCESELPEGAFPFVGGFSAMEAAEEAGSAEVGGVTSVFFFTTGFLSFPEHMQWEFCGTTTRRDGFPVACPSCRSCTTSESFLFYAVRGNASIATRDDPWA